MGEASCSRRIMIDHSILDKYDYIMKTMSITIDEATLRVLDDLVGTASIARSRSAFVRTAIREFVEREGRRQVEARERQILRKHRKGLARQARVLIEEQARL